jgi:hypothetical protein
MKAITRILVVVILVAITVPLLPASAQDEGPSTGFFVQEAESGTMADNGDGTYTLTLVGVGENIKGLLAAPEVGLSYYNAGLIALYWTSNPDGLEATAILETADQTLTLTLSAPAYDLEADSMTYTASVVVPEGEKDVTVAEEFGPATLTIIADDVFAAGLNTGKENAGARPIQCTMVYKPMLGMYIENCKYVP